MFDRARKVFPGGVTRASIAMDPHPLYAVSGDGCRLQFLDGHAAIDFHNNFTSLVLGHRHPSVMKAVQEQLERGVVLGSPTPGEVELAEELMSRMPSAERLIFATTGSEAVMVGLRVARTITGREGVAKFEGGYHGGYDHAKVSGMVDPERWGNSLEPAGVPDTAGLPEDTTRQVHIMGFNNLASVEQVLDRHRRQIGVLVMEPVLGVGGLIPPEPRFLDGVRALCDQHGVLLLFDEVITMRLGKGGAQEYYGVIPDLFVGSKVLASGFPISILAGRADLMEVLDRTTPRGRPVYHSGTYNANPLSVAASLATLSEFNDSLIAHLNYLGDLARRRLLDLFTDRAVPMTVTGVGSLFNVHFASDPPKDYRGARLADQSRLREFHRRMLASGVYLASRGLGCISAPMTEAEIDVLVATTEDVIDDMVP